MTISSTIYNDNYKKIQLLPIKDVRFCLTIYTFSFKRRLSIALEDTDKKIFLLIDV